MSQTLTVTGAAALHGVSVKAVRHAISTGALKAEKLPGVTGPYLLRPKDIEKWLEGRSQTRRDGGYFAALARLDQLPLLIARHASITADLPLADVVIACSCTPDIERDGRAWAEHLRDVLSGAEKTSDALAS